MEKDEKLVTSTRLMRKGGCAQTAAHVMEEGDRGRPRETYRVSKHETSGLDSVPNEKSHSEAKSGQAL